MLLAGPSVIVVVTRLQGRRGGLRFAQRTPWWGEGGGQKRRRRICTVPFSFSYNTQSLISFTTPAPAWWSQGDPITLLLLSATDAGKTEGNPAQQPLDRLALKACTVNLPGSQGHRRRHAPDATVSLKLTRAVPVFVDGLLLSRDRQS